MTRYAVISNDVIVNVVIWNGYDPWLPPSGCVTAPVPAVYDIGWLWNNGSPINPTPPPIEIVSVPTECGAGDFMRALYELGWYNDVHTAAEATGGLARLLWRRANKFERHHPLVTQIATVVGKTQADLDTLFLKTLQYR